MPPGDEMDLSKLRQFIELARVGHYGRASARLGIAQPQLSRTMRRFEQEMGVELLRRHSRGVVTTDFGRNLAEIGEAVLSMVDAIHAPVKDLDARGKDEVVIGLPPRLGPVLTDPIFKMTRQRWPDRGVRFVEASTAVLESDTTAGRIQVSLLQNAPDVSELTVVPLIDERLVFTFAPLWSLSLPTRPLRLREVAEYPLILPTAAHGDRRLIMKAESRYGLRLRAILEVDAPMTLRALVNAGVGATITGGPSLQEDLLRGTLVSHPIADPVLQSRFCVATVRSRMTRGVTAELLEIVSECVTSLVQDGHWPHAEVLPRS